MVGIPPFNQQSNKYPFIVLEVTEEAIRKSKLDVSSKTIKFGGTWTAENKEEVEIPLHLITKQSHGDSIPYQIMDMQTDPKMKISFLTICSEQNIESINISVKENA